MDVSRLPKKLVICGVPFVVRYKDKIDGDGEETVYGQTYGHERLIEVNVSAHQTDQAIRLTLLHEALHAALHVTGHSEGLSDTQEEGLVIALENALVGIMQQVGAGYGKAKS